MFRYVAFVDEVLMDIERYVGSHRPCRGGGLLGPVGQPVITAFLDDPGATADESSFLPSPALREALSEWESRDPLLELKGVVHSHPGGSSYPSVTDTLAVADNMSLVPWLGRFVHPIVTQQSRRREGHELVLPSALMSVYISEPRPDGTVTVLPAQVHMLPIARDARRLATVLDGQLLPLGTVDVQGVVYVSAVVRLPGVELRLLFSPQYPFQAPIVLGRVRESFDRSGRTLPRSLAAAFRPRGITTLALTWDLSVPEEVRLERAFSAGV